MKKICPHCGRAIPVDFMGFQTHGPGKDGSFICRGSRNISAAQQAVALDDGKATAKKASSKPVRKSTKKASNKPAHRK